MLYLIRVLTLLKIKCTNGSTFFEKTAVGIEYKHYCNLEVQSELLLHLFRLACIIIEYLPEK